MRRCHFCRIELRKGFACLDCVLEVDPEELRSLAERLRAEYARAGGQEKAPLEQPRRLSEEEKDRLWAEITDGI